MRVLFDENVSPRLVTLLNDLFPESKSVIDLGVRRISDVDLWQQANKGGFILASKDSDFVDRPFLDRFQVKVIWCRLGNCTTEAIHLVMRNSFDRIKLFAESGDSVLILP